MKLNDIWRLAWLTSVVVLTLTTVPASAQEFDPYPLRPPDTSSPRGTLKSFISNMNLALQAHENDDQYESLREWDKAVQKHVNRALRTLDLSDVQPARKNEIGVNRAVLLKEVLDRVEIPSFELIPGPGKTEADAGADETAASSDVDAPSEADETEPRPVSQEQEIVSWALPDTEIRIARIEEGPRKGEFLFTRDTVERAPEFFERVQVLVPKAGATISAYQVYRSTAGYWFDPDWIAGLPSWSTTILVDNPIWRWILLAATLCVLGLVIVVLFRWGANWDAARGSEGRQRRLGRALASILAILTVWFADAFIAHQIVLSGQPLLIVSSLLNLAVAAIAVRVVWLVMDQIAQSIIGMRGLRQRSVDAHMVRVTFRILTFGVIIFVVIKVAEELGVPVTPVLAGLGVGGLAVALAARPTLENIIGGVILFADRPVRVGDFFRWGNEVGTVQEIGLRSTRILKNDRTVVTIPNADFSSMQLENFQVRDMILWQTTLEVRRDTSPGQLEYVLAKMREMLIAHPKVSPDPARVRVFGLSESGIVLDVFVYVLTPDINEYHAILEDLLLRIMRILEDAGTGFALPTQLHPPMSFGHDEQRARAAEEEVEAWRKQGRLPFPEFANEDRDRVDGSLDYPREGSPDFAPARQGQQSTAAAQTEDQRPPSA